MATLKEYLKTVQELEVSVFFNKLIYGFWNLKLNELINTQKNRIQGVECQLEEKRNKINDQKAKLQSLEKTAEEEYPVEKVEFIFNLILSLIIGALLGLAIYYLFIGRIIGFAVGCLVYIVYGIVSLFSDGIEMPGEEFISAFADYGQIILAIAAPIAVILYTLIDCIVTAKKNKVKLHQRKSFVEQKSKAIPTKIATLTQEMQQLQKELSALQYMPLGVNLPDGIPYTPEILATITTLASYYQQLKIMEVTLAKLYAQNIIHEKYRNLIPVSSFCDYFDTGRCDTLTGHEGAYNLYENELRMDKVIDKLDNIEGKLDDIKKNQYYLATSLERGFARLKESQAASTDQLSGLLSAQTSQYSALNATANRLLKEGVTVKFE